ncbi:hypothetical protein Cgig2_010023 [Carnegiea gigantea]|uniref:Uncharacterized protein n=1 Tax=Carnegiea gigantea TaxID=171969 RepID=A0A9Q1K336_9CARY|nr:hypothetical protein Cgig2_010023 [Carnegiea gigantea]
MDALYNNQIKQYREQVKFMLPDGVKVNFKLLMAVWEKVGAYECSLKCKYVKEGATKEPLYNLGNTKHLRDINESTKKNCRTSGNISLAGNGDLKIAEEDVYLTMGFLRGCKPIEEAKKSDKIKLLNGGAKFSTLNNNIKEALINLHHKCAHNFLSSPGHWLPKHPLSQPSSGNDVAPTAQASKPDASKHGISQSNEELKRKGDPTYEGTSVQDDKKKKQNAMKKATSSSGVVRHTPAVSHRHSEGMRKAAHAGRNGQSRGENSDHSIGADTLDSRRPSHGWPAKSTTASTPYAMHSRRTAWCEEQE